MVSVPPNSEWEQLRPEPVSLRSRFPACENCHHPWHGLQCRQHAKCGCLTSFKEAEPDPD